MEVAASVNSGLLFVFTSAPRTAARGEVEAKSSLSVLRCSGHSSSNSELPLRQLENLTASRAAH
eukprot:9613-Heterococcus_DN1.PRE.3